MRLLILLLIPFQVLSNTSWQKSTSINSLQNYHHPQNKKIILNIQKLKIKKIKSFNQPIFKEFEKEKKQTLSYFGILDWSVSRYSQEKIKQIKILKIQGFYHRTQGDKISFFEYHYNKNGINYQATLTYPSEIKNKDFIKEAEGFLF